MKNTCFQDVSFKCDFMRFALNRFRNIFITLFVFLQVVNHAKAQVSAYDFAQAIAPSGYIDLTSGTTAFAAPWDNQTPVQVPIGFSITYDGAVFSNCYISPNGFITLGSVAPSETDFIPLTTATAYNAGNTGGALVPMGGDWISNGSPIEYGVIGTAPNRIFIVQWADANRKSGVTILPGDFNFQVRISEATSSITFSYGNCDSGLTTTNYNVQVGLRGFNNVLAQGNVLNRFQGSSQLWASAGATSQGATNTATLFTNPSAYPNFGLQYTYTPTPPCVVPAAQPTSLVVGATNITHNSFLGNSFVAANPAPSRYLVVRSLSNVAPTSTQFVNRTYYPVGTVIGAYTVVASTAGTIFNQLGLAQNTTYYYWIIPCNDRCYGAPFYNLNAIITTSATTCVTPTVAAAASAVGGNGFVANWSNVATATSYSIDISTNSTFTAILPAYTNYTVAAGINSLTVTGLLPLTTYFYRVRANGPGCVLNSGTISVTTTCGFYTIPYFQNFDTTAVGSLPNCFSAINTNADTQTWSVQNTTFSSAPRSVIINANPTLDMNDWLMSPGLNLTGGVSYRLIFRYKTGSLGTDAENLTVYYGASQTIGGMTNILSNLNGITNSFFESITIDFTPATSAVYYLGFKGSSMSDQSYIALDDISVTLSPSCIDPTNVSVDSIGSTTASVSWTASTVAPSSGYEYYIATTVTAPTAATPPTGSVGPGQTSVSLTGLLPSTSYWLWVRGKCAGSDRSVWTAEESFNTECSTPSITSTIPVTRCGYGNGTLTANASTGAVVRWYSAATGGTLLGSGTTIATPNTSTSITYFAEARSLGAIAKLGPTNPVAQLGIRAVQTFVAQMDFTVTSVTTLQSVDIFPMVSGQTGRFVLRTNTNIPLGTINYTTTVSGGNTLQSVPVNIALDPGNYNLYFETLPASGLRMNTTNAAYPYSNSVATLDGNSYDFNASLGAYNWKFTTQCLSARVPVTLTVTAPPAFSLSQSDVTICEDETTSLITVTGGSSYTSFVWSPNTGVSGSVSAGFTFNPTQTTTYTLVANQSSGSFCGNIATITVNVKAAPPAVAILPANPTICQGDILQLAGSTSLATPSVVFTEEFNAPTNNWTVANTSTGGNPLNSQFTLVPSGYNYVNAFGWNATFSSPDASQFYLANADSQNTVAGSVTRTTLTSPTFSLAGYTTAQVRFSHYIRAISGDKFWVQVSTNNGTTWTTIQSYAVVQGATNAFSNVIIALTPYIGMNDLKIRFNFESNWGYCWAIDSVSVYGTLAAAMTWSPPTNLFTDAAATIPYVAGTPLSVVYSKPMSAISYSATLTGSNGCIRSGISTVSVDLPTIPGVLGESQLICSAGTPNPITLTGYVGSILRWESASDAAFTLNITPIANTSPTLTVAQMGSLNPIKYFRAVVKSGQCNLLYSNIVFVGVPVTTWNGTSWSFGAPNSTTRAIFAGSFSSTGDLYACSVTVNSGTVVFNSGHSLIVVNDVNVPGGRLNFMDKSSLVQINDTAVNSGNIAYRRSTTPMLRFDYTYWSSPVAGQVFNILSPLTPIDKFYAFDPVAANWLNVAPSSIMSIGKGYIVRAPNTYSNVTPTVFTGAFAGVPNNGVVNVPVLNSNSNYNLIGNPYPSALSADAFLSNVANQSVIDGTLYFWTHNTPITNNNYTNNDYAIYNFLGGTGTVAANSTGVNTSIPTGKVAAGQGFFVKALSNGNAFFSNSMRIINDNDQFYRTVNETQAQSNTGFNRYWLDISNGSGAFKQLLIGYNAQATLGIDRGFDSDYLNVGLPMALYSVLPSGEKLSIQGRPMPFDASDRVALGFTATTLDDFTIRLSSFEGLFSTQQIYLRDKYLQLYHDLKASDYYFRSPAGTFEDRFEIVYTNGALGGQEFQKDNALVLYNPDGTIRVLSTESMISSIKVYDLRGGLLTALNEVNSFEKTVPLQVEQQVLLFEIQLDTGQVVYRKYIK